MKRLVMILVSMISAQCFAAGTALTSQKAQVDNAAVSLDTAVKNGTLTPKQYEILKQLIADSRALMVQSDAQPARSKQALFAFAKAQNKLMEVSQTLSQNGQALRPVMRAHQPVAPTVPDTVPVAPPGR